MAKNNMPQCVHCHHLALPNSVGSFLETPCKHLYCDRCVHRLFSLQSRISCSSCSRALYRHELTQSSVSQEDQFDQAVANIRKRVFASMNKERVDCNSTPEYDKFLEDREDLVLKFIRLQEKGSTDELNKILQKYERENQQAIVENRANADERLRKRIEEIIKEEGTFYERVNVDYNERDSVTDHPLALQYADLLNKRADATVEKNFNTYATMDLLNRRARLIPDAIKHAPGSVPQVADASGCRDLWMRRAEEAIANAFGLESLLSKATMPI